MSSRWPKELSRKLAHFKHFRQFLGAGLDLVFPQKCILCKRIGEDAIHKGLCPSCRAEIFQPCFVPYAGPDHSTLSAIAAGRFQGPLRELIVNVKFKADPFPLPSLHRLLDQLYDLHKSRIPFDCVTTVPAQKERLSDRGVDLPALLARKFARRLRRSFEPGLILRTKATTSQTEKSRKARFENLLTAFRANRTCERRSILVVDDVITTGATASTISKELLRSGAKTVSWMTLAYTPLSNKT